jgi:hypothetical protein
MGNTAVSLQGNRKSIKNGGKHTGSGEQEVWWKTALVETHMQVVSGKKMDECVH